jgi:hypothetical protein
MLLRIMARARAKRNMDSATSDGRLDLVDVDGAGATGRSAKTAAAAVLASIPMGLNQAGSESAMVPSVQTARTTSICPIAFFGNGA